MRLEDLCPEDERMKMMERWVQQAEHKHRPRVDHRDYEILMKERLLFRRHKRNTRRRSSDMTVVWLLEQNRKQEDEKTPTTGDSVGDGLESRD